jgi:hypothetical protein
MFVLLAKELKLMNTLINSLDFHLSSYNFNLSKVHNVVDEYLVLDSMSMAYTALFLFSQVSIVLDILTEEKRSLRSSLDYFSSQCMTPKRFDFAF